MYGLIKAGDHFQSPIEAGGRDPAVIPNRGDGEGPHNSRGNALSLDDNRDNRTKSFRCDGSNRG